MPQLAIHATPHVGRRHQLRAAVRTRASAKVQVVQFCLNGQLANYAALRDELLETGDSHLSRDNDTEIILHALSRRLSSVEHNSPVPSSPQRTQLADLFHEVCKTLTVLTTWSIECPWRNGDRPRSARLATASLCQGGNLFAATSESVGLLNLGYSSRKYQIARSGGDDHDQQRPVWRSSGSCHRRAKRTASLSGFTLPMSPARWTGKVSIFRASGSAKSSRGSKMSRSTRTRSSCPSRTQAKPLPMRWPIAWVSLRSKD